MVQPHSTCNTSKPRDDNDHATTPSNATPAHMQQPWNNKNTPHRHLTHNHHTCTNHATPITCNIRHTCNTTKHATSAIMQQPRNTKKHETATPHATLVNMQHPHHMQPQRTCSDNTHACCCCWLLQMVDHLLPPLRQCRSGEINCLCGVHIPPHVPLAPSEMNKESSH